MKSLTNSTNGFIVLSDAFSSSVFKQSFARLFSKDKEGCLKMGFGATVEVQCSRELKVCGLIGPGVSAAKKSSCVGETVILIVGNGRKSVFLEQVHGNFAGLRLPLVWQSTLRLLRKFKHSNQEHMESFNLPLCINMLEVLKG